MNQSSKHLEYTNLCLNIRIDFKDADLYDAIIELQERVRAVWWNYWYYHNSNVHKVNKSLLENYMQADIIYKQSHYKYFQNVRTEVEPY